MAELLGHILLDELHGSMPRPLDHYLNVLLPCSLCQLAAGILFLSGRRLA